MRVRVLQVTWGPLPAGPQPVAHDPSLLSVPPLQVTWGQFLLHNLLPVTLGNTFAGFFLMACAYSLSYGSLSKKLEAKMAPAALKPAAA